MNQPQSFPEINIGHFLRQYRRYRIARFLLVNPVARLLLFIIGGLLLIIIWPIALIYLTFKLIRATRRRPEPRYTKHHNIIDL